MKNKTLIRYLDECMAVDLGSTDSGSNFNRDAAAVAIANMQEEKVGTIAREWCLGRLTPESRAEGYGWEDVAKVLEWLDDFSDHRLPRGGKGLSIIP